MKKILTILILLGGVTAGLLTVRAVGQGGRICQSGCGPCHRRDGDHPNPHR